MNRQILITGINGFVGEHLARHLQLLGYQIHGVGRDDAVNEKTADVVAKYTKADLLNKESVAAIGFSDTKAIIHLAGLASVGESFDKPDLYREGNAAMTDNLLTESAAQGFKGRVVVVSTGALYDPNQPLPLSETSKTIASSPYAEGKLKAEDITLKHIQNGVDAVIARPFNHIGPGQESGFLVPDLYQALVNAREQGVFTITTGNLNTRRDYTDVRDIVQAYTALALSEKLQHHLYNICSGTSTAGTEIFHTIQEATSTTDIGALVDPSRVRPTDPQELVGDSSRLQNELYWQPHITFFHTIQDFVNRKKAQ
jgi:GDP-4-dehydro-6-deoxy-D-mannose reductase